MAKKKPASEESPEVKQQEAEENNRCFIITPIGDENSEVRRAADGLIDAVVQPVLSELELIAVAPHRDYDPISITGRIVKNIVESRLVVANLTGLNPNVMYELAVRHAVAKPVVVIAERSTRLPFDLKDELAVFYDNDMKGVVELKDRLSLAIRAALESPQIDNPISRYKDVALLDLKGDAPDALRLILERIGGLEQRVGERKGDQRGTSSGLERRFAEVGVDGDGIGDALKEPSLMFQYSLMKQGVDIRRVEPRHPNRSVLRLICPLSMSDEELEQIVRLALTSNGIAFRSTDSDIPF